MMTIATRILIAAASLLIAFSIWQLLSTEVTVDDVVRTVRDEFDVDEDRCSEDVLTFIQELADLRLVRLVA